MEGALLEAVEVIESQSTSLDCKISGTEPLEIEWLKGSSSLSLAGSRNDFVQISSKGRKLHVLSARTSDEGRYTCVGRNAAGEARKNFQLIVLGKNRTAEQPEIF